MKTTGNQAIGIILILTFFSCQNQIDNSESNVKKGTLSDSTNSASSFLENGEEFDNFLLKFCEDVEFQKARVKFPFIDLSISGESNKDTINAFIQKDKWQHLALILEEKYIIQKYDNFECKLRNTNERVLAYEGIDNGIGNYYFFKKFDGTWYLTKRLSYLESETD